MPEYPKKCCYSIGEPEVSVSCQDQSPEASKTPTLVLDPRPNVTVAAIPPSGTLTVLGATIQHVEGESQTDACHRLAAALMRCVAELRGLSVTLADDGALLALLPIAEESDG